jgi:hypothetical protein
MTDSESYLLTAVRKKSPEDVGGWKFTKYSDGTEYHVADAPDGLHCDCPGATQWGDACAGGKGCKHQRMVKALVSLMCES